MSDIDKSVGELPEIDLDALERAALEATPGPWEVETTDSEGSYGDGPDAREGFKAYGVFAGDLLLFDTLNSNAATIEEAFDGEDLYAWDETGRRNAEFASAANPTVVLGLVRRLRAALQSAQAPAGEAVAEVIESIEADRYFKCDVIVGSMPAVGTKLYTSQPDQSARIAELERQLDDANYRAGIAETSVAMLKGHANAFMRQAQEAGAELEKSERKIIGLGVLAMRSVSHEAYAARADQITELKYERDDLRRQLAEAQARETELRDAIQDRIATIYRQLELIAERAQGDFLDKSPVVQSLHQHIRRMQAVLHRPTNTSALSKSKEGGAA